MIINEEVISGYEKELIKKPKGLSENDLNLKDYIFVKGAKIHNLKNITVAIPRNKLVVITGVSGSGKSSLAFDTLYAEGQRRYVESLSSYARQFLEKMNKPEVDYIKGLSPAIAIQQKVASSNPRSTVGTSTEIYDYLKLLFARIGKTFSPVSGKEVKRHSVSDVVNFIYELTEGTNIQLLIPFETRNNRSLKEELNILLQKGFTRILYMNEVYKIEDFLEANFIDTDRSTNSKKQKKSKSNLISTNDICTLIDRFILQHNEETTKTRIADSLNTAFHEGDGKCIVFNVDNNSKHFFSNKFEMDGITFVKPSENFFNFNNPYGACAKCEGFGSITSIDPDLVVPNKNLSIFDEAIACWKGEKMSLYKQDLVLNAYKFDFPVHRPYNKLTEKQKQLLWEGNQYFIGINDFFKWVESENYKIQYRVLISRYRGKTLCDECKGTRIRKDSLYVKINEKTIADIVLMPISDCLKFFKEISLSNHDFEISKRIVAEITNRLQCLVDVGLGYLTLNRLSFTLSGGESQRIKLSTSLGSTLVNSMYILDEPSIGLHPRDTQKLIGVLKSLRNLQNTVIVVEHDEDIMKAADEIIDIGPLAGTLGGELVAQGNIQTIINEPNSLTGKHFNNSRTVNTFKSARKSTDYIEIIGARENNLKNINVKFPLNVITAVTGVSGSGKSSLVQKILYRALKNEIYGFGEKPGSHDKVSGDISKIKKVEIVDQNPIGISSRSNPVTYIKAYDEIRKLYSEQRLSKIRGYKTHHFSFNVEGGRCDVCEGEGTVTIEMQFMADIYLLCENCKGQRFKNDVLEVTYNEKNIAEVLELTVDEALLFFKEERKIVSKLQVLSDVGLGYIKLGQSSSTLSGGEAQRVKLACFLSQHYEGIHTLFIFDEPTTGLHYHDIKKLLCSFNALIEQGNTIIIIEHNKEVIKNSDWLIDLGPEGGDGGGKIIFEGIPSQAVNCKQSHTGKFLQNKPEN